jgi:hypothetical protein
MSIYEGGFVSAQVQPIAGNATTSSGQPYSVLNSGKEDVTLTR